MNGSNKMKALETAVRELEKRQKERQLTIQTKIEELDSQAAVLRNEIAEKRQEVVSLELAGGGIEVEDLKAEIKDMRLKLFDLEEQKETYAAVQSDVPQEDIEELRKLAREADKELSDQEAALQAELNKITGKIEALEKERDQVKKDLTYLGFNRVSDVLDEISYLLYPEAAALGTYRRRRFWKDFIDGKDVTSYFQN
jgi:chromosome segregation ATPase